MTPEITLVAGQPDYAGDETHYMAVPAGEANAVIRKLHAAGGTAWTVPWNRLAELTGEADRLRVNAARVLAEAPDVVVGLGMVRDGVWEPAVREAPPASFS